ncbi:hypothetical protein H7I76_38095, partial [Mycolicibacterium vaccae]|nr:hypothetical protein [Mycolicibacterium vaccae]
MGSWHGAGSRGAGRRCGGLLPVVAAASLGYALWQLIWHAQYRIDIDVYRMGGQAWLDGRPLYSGGTMFRHSDRAACLI